MEGHGLVVLEFLQQQLGLVVFLPLFLIVLSLRAFFLIVLPLLLGLLWRVELLEFSEVVVALLFAGVLPVVPRLAYILVDGFAVGAGLPLQQALLAEQVQRA